MIAEITVENLEMKESLRLGDLPRIPAASRTEVIRIVLQTKQRFGWPAHRTLAGLGIPHSVYYDWRRRECLDDCAGVPCRENDVLPECRNVRVRARVSEDQVSQAHVDDGGRAGFLCG